MTETLKVIKKTAHVDDVKNIVGSRLHGASKDAVIQPEEENEEAQTNTKKVKGEDEEESEDDK